MNDQNEKLLRLLIHLASYRDRKRLELEHLLRFGRSVRLPSTSPDSYSNGERSTNEN